ncbi:MAG: LemA family protein [Candidatus Altiarchaeota archaeon]|nr:LemA family protein [Candidatus Altiarchaeota archaeon]
MVLGIILGVASGLVLLYFVMAYNGFIVMRNSISRAASNIDVMLKQRYDEIGKLIDTIKGYKKYEKKTLMEVTKLRKAFEGAATTQEKLAVNSQMNAPLMNLFAVAENYPDLKANENFKHLQGRISSLENEISDRREGYNSTVFEFNNKVQSIPSSLVASLTGFKEKEMFKASAEEKKDVKISF